MRKSAVPSYLPGGSCRTGFPPGVQNRVHNQQEECSTEFPIRKRLLNRVSHQELACRIGFPPGTGELKRGSCQEQKAGKGFRASGKREEQGFPPGKGVLNRGSYPRRESTGQGFPLGQGFPPEEVKNNVFQLDEGFRQRVSCQKEGHRHSDRLRLWKQPPPPSIFILKFS
jgi:hypothetical protein